MVTFASLGACSGGPEQHVQVVAPMRPRNAMMERLPSECPAEMVQHSRMCTVCPIVPRATCLAKCNSGDADACALYAFSTAIGVDSDPDLATAARYYRKGCDGGSLMACEAVADAIYRGDGYPKDELRARTMLEDICAKGLSSACVGVATILLRAGEAKAAFAWAERGCTDRYGCTSLARLCVQDPAHAPPRCVESAAARACQYGHEASCGGTRIPGEASAAPPPVLP
jgi:TPR repeat protein